VEVAVIRPVTPDDAATVIGLAIASGLFPPDAADFLHHMMTDYFGGKQAEGHVCIIAEEVEPVGVAYYEPARATDRTWYLTMIAVRGDMQGQGHGAALTHAVEQALQAQGQRVLLVETSGLPDFARTRRFYVKCGYAEEARVRDYYTVGEDMVLFRKVLNVQ
jgi:ribosomal protein S18 acetylase RimI-like enzyme